MSHYRLVEKIGEGGMGVVWKAEDTVLDRTVAIKVLPAGVAVDEVRRGMFLDEARLAASVSHAAIVQVYELGRERDLDFIVMEHVEGQPLSRLLHGRPLPPDKVAEWGLQVAQGMARAHRKGLLHRDLKPANILVTPDGEVKIVDFGLASLFSQRETSAGSMSTLTANAPTAESGGIAGTVPYMSPEQVRGEKLDARSDIFSFGTMLYEMTTGQRPFAGATPAEVAQEILRSQPIPLHELVPKAPLELDRIIEKALVARPSDRYQHMDDLAVDLRRLGKVMESGSSPSYQELQLSHRPALRWRGAALRALAGAGIIAGLAAGGWLAWPRLHRTGGASTDHTVLILPLEVRGMAEGADYVGLAFAEALAVNLAEAKNLKVLPVAPNPAAKGDPAGPSRVARQQGAGRVLVGAMTRGPSAAVASVSLLDAGENRVVWGTQLDIREGEMATVASALAWQIARQLGADFRKLYDLPEGALRRSAIATSPLVSEALGALQRQESRFAVEAAERVVEAFPNEPDAQALRVQVTLEAWHRGHSPVSEAALERAIASLERVDAGHPMPEVARGFVESGAGKVSDSVARFTRILARDDIAPDLRAHVLTLRGWNEFIVGHNDAAIRDLEAALRLAPANGRSFAMLASCLYSAGRLEESLTRGRQAATLSPTDPQVYFSLSQVLRSLQRWDEAVTAAAKAFELAPTQSNGALYATCLLLAGRGSEALEAARGVEGLEGEGDVDVFGLYNLACYWALAGNRANALRDLRRASELGLDLPAIERDPDLRSLYGDSEFEAIAAKIGKRAALRP